MARLTVEDCLPNVENRFELVLKASARARQLERGAEAAVAWDKDKPTVVALREIAAGVLNDVSAETLRKAERPMSFMSAEEAADEMAAKLLEDDEIIEEEIVAEDVEEESVEVTEEPVEEEAVEVVEEPVEEISIEEEVTEE